MSRRGVEAGRPTIRMVCVDASCPTLLATVELDRPAGLSFHERVGTVELVDHVRVWVFEGGVVLGATLRRSAVKQGRVLASCDLDPVPQASLNLAERVDVLHAAGLRTFPAEPAGLRWGVM